MQFLRDIDIPACLALRRGRRCLHHANLSGFFSQRFHGIQRQPVAFMQRCFILNRCTTDFILAVLVLIVLKSILHPFFFRNFCGLSRERDEDGEKEEEQHGSHGHRRVGRTHGATQEHLINVIEGLSEQPTPTNRA